MTSQNNALAMLCQFLPVQLFLLVLLFSMAAKKVATINTETVLSMLDSSLSGSELHDSGNELDNDLREDELQDNLQGAMRESSDKEVYSGSQSIEQRERGSNVSVKGGPSSSMKEKESDESESYESESYESECIL